MLLFDVLLRYSAIAIALLLAALLSRDGWRSKQIVLAVLLLVSASAIWMSTAPDILKLPSIAYAVTRALDVPSLILLWWFGLSLFEDDWNPNALQWIIGGGHMLVVAMFRLEEFGVLGEWVRVLIPYLNLVSIALIIHLVWRLIAGHALDLIETRRRFRAKLALGLILVGLISVLGEIFLFDQRPDLASLLRAGAGLPVLIWTCFLLIKTQPSVLLFEPQDAKDTNISIIDPRDHALHKRLLEALDVEHMYKEQGLTIGHLATHLNVPEHQLRAFINQGLGYRNFSSFLNSFRLRYVKTVLSDAEQARLPVLTIAMDAGFASLSSFNRIFKKCEGTTPTAFRSAALKDLPKVK